MNPGPVTAAVQLASGDIHELLREYVFSACLVEIVFRDQAGRIRLVHEVIRDLFVRAGQGFVLLGRSRMIRLDQILILNGHRINGAGVS